MKTKSKYLLLSISFALFAFITIGAQPPGGGKGRGQGYRGPDSCRIQLRVDDMRQALDLSENQVKQIEEIHYAHVNEAKAIQKDYQDDCVGEREARRSLREKMDKEVKATLKKEQLAKYDEFMEARRGPHGHRHKKG